MNQSTLDPNLAPEGPASEPSAARQGSTTHRRRRSAAHKTQQRPEQVATPAASAGTPAAETVSGSTPAPVAHPAPVSPPDVTAAATDMPLAPAEPPRARSAGRSRRRTSGGRKNDVQLVIPPSADGDATAEVAPSLDTESAPETPGPSTADVRVEPVTTEAAEPATPLASEPADTAPLAAGTSPSEAGTTQAEAADFTEPAPGAARRYRFDRKATAVPYAPASRPERLSGTLATPATPQTAESENPAPQPIAGEAAEAYPAFPSLAFAPGESAEATATSDAIDDIVSALGLRDAAARAPIRLPVEGVAPVVEEPEHAAEAEAEESPEAEAETEAATDTAATGTSRRRPRRRRRGSSHAASAGEEDAEEMLATEPLAEPAPSPRTREPRRSAPPTPITEPERPGSNGYEQYTTPEYAPEYESSYAPFGQTERQPWDVSQGQSQIGQPESPFGSPAPSVVRGFGPQPRGVAGPARETFSRTGRTERIDTPPMSSNQLANMVTHAIQQQTDRMLNELRYHPQSPGMTVMFPAFPSTERVGVFVDVANLLYSSRNLRITVDFGKLLEFLRGSRRLIRAHAYAPTNPDPRADQSFLDAVKGLGYRITTKNYKTFASGAKKADMDLDLCMDIVRMVDAGAVDTIVLVSGDSDFLPLLEYCSDHGVRVEVAAFEDAAAAILRQSCDLFVNLSLVNDIRM